AHVNHRQMFFERYPLVEMPAAPSSALCRLPVNRMLGTHLFSPAPSRRTPIAFMRVAAGFNELRKLRVAYCSTGNLERRDMYRMRPFLVIEYKGLIRRRSKIKAPAWHFRIPRERSCLEFKLQLVGIGHGIPDPRDG